MFIILLPYRMSLQPDGDFTIIGTMDEHVEVVVLRTNYY